MSSRKEIRGRVTSVCAVAALAVSLLNIGLTQAGAATTNPETDKAYGIINEDGTAKAGISSIADIKNNMTTTGADFVVDVDEDGHAESVLSPTEIRNLLDVSYAADARLERSLNDLKTTTESTYAKKSEIPSTTNFLTKTDASNTYLSKTNASSTYATKSEIPSLSNYYTKDQVDAKIPSSTSSSDQPLPLARAWRDGPSRMVKCPHCDATLLENTVDNHGPLLKVFDGSVPYGTILAYKDSNRVGYELALCQTCRRLFLVAPSY